MVPRKSSYKHAYTGDSTYTWIPNKLTSRRWRRVSLGRSPAAARTPRASQPTPVWSWHPPRPWLALRTTLKQCGTALKVARAPLLPSTVAAY